MSQDCDRTGRRCQKEVGKRRRKTECLLVNSQRRAWTPQLDAFVAAPAVRQRRGCRGGSQAG